jgi:hypothetical protein
MEPVFQTSLPKDMLDQRPLPGIQPVRAEWLRVDEAYAGQMAQREQMLASCRADVLWSLPDALGPALELLDFVLERLPSLGFAVSDSTVACPDGRRVGLDRDDPLATLGRLVQCDFCLLDRDAGPEHVLKGAVLCFPASWRLDEKAGRPLTAIHDPVPDYDERLAARVQRLFDGVQPGRPIWRFNRLWYQSPALHHPRSVHDPRPTDVRKTGDYLRSERQTIFRLPESRWVVFAIHTFVLRARDVPAALRRAQIEVPAR